MLTVVLFTGKFIGESSEASLDVTNWSSPFKKILRRTTLTSKAVFGRDGMFKAGFLLEVLQLFLIRLRLAPMHRLFLILFPGLLLLLLLLNVLLLQLLVFG